jgi:ATP-dependent Clp protease ATP-binding subunit ClpC
VSRVLDGFSAGARDVVSLAIAESRQLGHGRVGTEHLLLGLLADDGTAAQALRAGGATLASARYTVAEVGIADVDSANAGEPPFTPRAQRALERAGRFARRDREPEVTPDHVLLGVLDVEGLACQVLRGMGVDLARLRNAIAPAPAPSDDSPEVEPNPDGEQPVASLQRPRCPNCRADLDGNILESILDAHRDDDALTSVSIVYCATCGASLGVLRPDQS